MKRSRLLAAGLAGILLILSVTACANPSAKPISLKERQAAAAELDTRIVKASNEFGMMLHRQLVQTNKNKNIFISPTSISLALAMTYNGSKGQTQTAMAETMGWQDLSIDEINQGNRALLSLLQQTGNGVQLSVANSLWSRKGHTFNRDFMKTNQTYYEAKVTELDFNSPKAPDTINDWVKKNTHGKISKMIDFINPTEVLILMNAVYFQAGWKNEFQPSSTNEESFKLQDGSTKEVQMMAQRGNFEYMQDEGLQAIRLPYGEGQMDMLIILPDANSSLEALHEELWADHSRWLQPFQQSQGEIKLPRFRLEYGEELKDALAAMGMSQAFDSDKADYSGMAPVPPNLYISGVTHKTFVEVNEKGTEAAAATAIHADAGSAPVDSPFQMTVNRPFYFAIEDRHSGAWLFVGSVIDP
ncbi:serpin family protein [Paenibacillus tarimensis]